MSMIKKMVRGIHIISYNFLAYLRPSPMCHLVTLLHTPLPPPHSPKNKSSFCSKFWCIRSKFYPITFGKTGYELFKTKWRNIWWFNFHYYFFYFSHTALPYLTKPKFGILTNLSQTLILGTHNCTPSMKCHEIKWHLFSPHPPAKNNTFEGDEWSWFLRVNSETVS